jgi:hypothetical protein
MAAKMTTKGDAQNKIVWMLLVTLAFVTVTVATAAPSFTPPVNSSAFEATAGGALYIGTVYGEDNFVAVVGVANLSACDPAQLLAQLNLYPDQHLRRLHHLHLLGEAQARSTRWQLLFEGKKECHSHVIYPQVIRP